MEAFAGLRFSSAFKLEKHDVNFVDKGILLPAHKLKTGKGRGGRRRYIDKLPENLWSWLAVTNDACWALQSSDWMHLKSDLFTKAKVPHPHNSLRHSFATHHMAWQGDAARTAAILCHKDQQELWEHYNGCATSVAGAAYFTITPLTAAAMAKDPKILGLTYPRPAAKI